jgi:hypothetical protein
MSELPNPLTGLGSLSAEVPNGPLALDRAELAPLIADLKRDLERLEIGAPTGPELDRLRAEVAQLWAALENGELTSAGLPERLSTLHGLLDKAPVPVGEAETGAFHAAGYFSAIGRMLGLD